MKDKGGETLLTTTYFGPVEWYQQLNRADVVYLEACESFIKQTYRNRCIIATANGQQALTVPIEHGGTPCSRPTAKAPSLSFTRTTSVHSSSKTMNSSTISTSKSCRRYVNSLTSIPTSYIVKSLE